MFKYRVGCIFLGVIAFLGVDFFTGNDFLIYLTSVIGHSSNAYIIWKLIFGSGVALCVILMTLGYYEVNDSKPIIIEKQKHH